MKNIADMEFRPDQPTVVDYDSLHSWVIWQFPRQVQQFFIAAVHPPLEEHGWYPALVRTDKSMVHVHGQLDKTYASPEEAADSIT